MPVIAHLSDLHLDADARSVGRAARITDYLGALPQPVDVVLVTGDIADHGAIEEYEAAARLLMLPYPVVVLPGNHDDRAAFSKVLLDQPDADGRPINRAHRIAGMTFLLLDSTIPGRPEGALADETIAWLDGALSEVGDEPTFVCMHHPPAVLGIPVVDGIRLQDTAALAEVIGRHPQVEGVLCGHAHTAASSDFAGVPLRVAPGIVSTAVLPCESRDGSPLNFDLPPAFAFHIVDDGELVTHIRSVG